MTFTRNTLTIIIIFIQTIVGVLTTASVLYAQEGGFFFIERPKLTLNTSYESEEEERKTPYMKTETESHDIQESLGIGTNGWAYHPNLMEYRLFLEPEWRQEKFEQWDSTVDSTQTNRRSTSVLAYDAGTTLLKNKPCSLDVFGNRNTRQIDITNVQDSDFTSETLGSRLNFTNPTLPASFAFVNRKVDQTGFYRSEEDGNELQAKIQHNAKHSVTELNVLHDNTDRTTQSTSETADITSDTTNTELTNSYFFAGDQSVMLDSLLYLTQAEYDDVDVNNWLASENFFWTHNKNLLSQYTLNFNQREVDNSETEEKALKALLTHRLYNSLTTNLGGGVESNDFDSGSEDRYLSNLGFIYRRPIPWGNIKLGAAYDYDMINRFGAGSIIPTQEFPVLTASEATFLEKENVILESIIVTDISGTIVYTENIDYRVQEIGLNVGISRTLLGAIADGQQVSVRYSYQVDSGYDDARFGQDYQFDLDLWSFSYFTYTHRRMDQNIISGDPPANKVDDTFNSVLLRFVAGWSETRFSYEDQDRKSGNSTVTRSVTELINFRPFKIISLNFSGQYGGREFTDINENERFYTLGSDMGWSPTWWCTFSLVCMRNEISGDLQDMLYTDFTPSVRLKYGVWTASVSYRLTDQKDRDFGDSLWQQRLYFVVNRALW